jgi:hypothetical protein
VSKLAIPSELNRSLDDELLDYPVNGIKEEPLVRTLARQEPVVVSGFTDTRSCMGQPIVGLTSAGSWVADSRLDSEIGGGRFIKPANANIRRFLDSLEVTIPTRYPYQPPRRPMRK